MLEKRKIIAQPTFLDRSELTRRSSAPYTVVLICTEEQRGRTQREEPPKNAEDNSRLCREVRHRHASDTGRHRGGGPRAGGTRGRIRQAFVSLQLLCGQECRSEVAPMDLRVR